MQRATSQQATKLIKFQLKMASSIELVVALTIFAATSALVRSDEINTSQQLNRSSINVTSTPTYGNQDFGSASDCLLLNLRFAHNQMIPKEMQPIVPNCDKECQCYNGKILCQPICEPISAEAPASLPCQPEMALQIQDDCCPKWMCTPLEEYALKNFSVTPLNATAVEVNFVLPLFAVGREGKAELNYTGLPLTDPASQSDLPPGDAIWSRRQNIRTANSVFPRQSIKYYMQQLKPNHRYWFKLGVLFADNQAPFDEMLESNLETATTLPLATTTSIPISTSSTTTTTTTTTTTPLLQTLAPATTSATSSTTTTPTSTTSTSTTTTPPPPQTLAPATTSTQPTTTTIAPQKQTLAPVTTTTPTPTPMPTWTSTAMNPPTTIIIGADIIKQSPSDMAYETSKQDKIPPCTLTNNNNNNHHHQHNNNEIDQQANLGMSLPWVQQVNVPLQKYASELFIALVCVSILLLVTTFKLFRTSSYGHMAPQAYDNPSFTKLVSFYAQQPNDLLVDENNQNYSNNVILAERKNFEADKLSPLHRS